jgi:hypothetical protein
LWKQVVAAHVSRTPFSGGSSDNRIDTERAARVGDEAVREFRERLGEARTQLNAKTLLLSLLASLSTRTDMNDVGKDVRHVFEKLGIQAVVTDEGEPWQVTAQNALAKQKVSTLTGVKLREVSSSHDLSFKDVAPTDRPNT